MALQFGLLVPQGWTMDLAPIKDPIEAYETLTRVAQTADEVGFVSGWLVDHFHTTPQPSQEMTFECWMTTAARARDTQHIRIGQMVTCNSYRQPTLLAKLASTVDVLSHGRISGLALAGRNTSITPTAMPILTPQNVCERCAKRSRSFARCGQKKKPPLKARIIRCAAP